MKDEEKRKHHRQDMFWLVFEQKKEQLLGFIVELSLTGIRIWVKNKYKFDDKVFTILLKPPSEMKVEKMAFEVKKVWANENDNNNFYDMGCEITNLTHLQQINLNQLVSFFERESDKFFQDLDEVVGQYEG